MRHMMPLALLALLSTASLPAYSANRGTPEEAKAMAMKAAEFLHTVGADKAFAEFSAKGSVWHDRDLYVSVENTQSVLMAHGANPALVGRSMIDLRDVDGNPISGQIQQIKDAGWIQYKWLNPVTKAIERKTAYEVRVGDYVVGVGAYVK